MESKKILPIEKRESLKLEWKESSPIITAIKAVESAEKKIEELEKTIETLSYICNESEPQRMVKEVIHNLQHTFGYTRENAIEDLKKIILWKLI